MKTTLYLFMSLIVFACGNAASTNEDGTTEITDSTKILADEEMEVEEIMGHEKKALPEIDKENILAEMQNPKVLLYRNVMGSEARFSYGIRVYTDSTVNDAVFYEDNMAYIASVSMDTVRFGKKKTPELKIEYETYGSHSYGGNGGWAVSGKSMSIWDVNTLKPLLDLIITDGSSEHSNGGEEGAEGESNECLTTSKLTFNLNKKEVTRDSIITVCNDSERSAYTKEVYYFDGTTFKKRN